MKMVPRLAPRLPELNISDYSKRRWPMCPDAFIRGNCRFDRNRCAHWRPLRVLFVDGHRLAVASPRLEHIRRLGHRVDTATDGFVALRMAAQQTPDVVVIDNGISHHDSCQIARHLRFNFPKRDVWIIAVTSRIDQEHRHQCEHAGVDVLLSEPVDSETLETLLALELMRVNHLETAKCVTLSSALTAATRSDFTVN